jgi:hypothetical protein
MAVTLAATVIVLLGAGGAQSSICICAGGKNPALRVNAKGFAEVSWTSQGSRHYRVVTPRGRVIVGRMSGRDVSFPTSAVTIPYKRVLKRTPSGAFWALQAWAKPGEPLNLRFSRWKGQPTRLTAKTTCCSSGRETLSGHASFHGTPIYGWVYVDCYRCALNPSGWARATRIATNTSGNYSLRIGSAWRGTRYRVTMVGPKSAWTRAPDARAYASSSL